ncbi:sugar transferase [Defluviimonas sp. WL0002]|uniref:Sugar transferase n=1 Tax=Albidovulum marisflavi TaxID=2984159 RepID=A0ABT2Z974_9RHOB|nr:sugar transferase [Defluviimonas sp. WL0002]MCV2867316.1 sugar transferase [Defluviimonas sp. WL0002]
MNNLSEALAQKVAPAGLVHVPHQSGLYRNIFKRVMDIMLVLAGSVIVLPLIGFLAILVAVDGHSPFYRSDRVGRNGRTFHMLKLRTMVPGADRMLRDYLAQNEAARREWESKQKLSSDPRITRIGRFLRKSSLDELPQLWNVLVGEMSLVGPRPMLPEQRDLYSGLSYYALRPGVTGLWQVSERNTCEFARRAEFDRQYERDLSLPGDLLILAATLRVVVKGTGC